MRGDNEHSRQPVRDRQAIAKRDLSTRLTHVICVEDRVRFADRVEGIEWCRARPGVKSSLARGRYGVGPRTCDSRSRLLRCSPTGFEIGSGRGRHAGWCSDCTALRGRGCAWILHQCRHLRRIFAVTRLGGEGVGAPIPQRATGPIGAGNVVVLEGIEKVVENCKPASIAVWHAVLADIAADAM